MLDGKGLTAFEPTIHSGSICTQGDSLAARCDQARWMLLNVILYKAYG